jgi:hypothetical protein
MSPINAVLENLGFKKHHFVQGRSHIRDLFKGQVCGIYVLHFENSEHYVGQSTDIVKRYAQHVKNRPDIQQISFKVVGKADLDSEEKRVTKALENSGLLLRNIQNITYSFGKTSLDELMPPAVQERFYTDMNFLDLDGERQDEPNIRRHYHNHYLKFMSLLGSDQIVNALAIYVTQTIPTPKRTEMIYWNVSCMTGRDKYPLIRINVGMQMTVEVLFQKEYPLFYVYITRELLSEILPFPIDGVSEKMRLFTIPDTKLDDEDTDLEIGLQTSFLKAGGDDQLIMALATPYDLMRATFYFQPIMRIFNLGLMQKSHCMWSKSHCFDLADHLFIEPLIISEDETDED